MSDRTAGSQSYLPEGMPAPTSSRDGLDTEHWQGLQNERLLIQRCTACSGWQWGPEFVCHRCHSFDLAFEEVEPVGTIYSHQRVWHPVHPALREHGPFVIVLVELASADNVRVVGNLLGDPHQPLEIGAKVSGVFEHHPDNDPPFTLLQWVVDS